MRIKFLSIALLLAAFHTSCATAGSARDAWNHLVETSSAHNYKDGFEFVENNPKLPNVLLLGDSISIHYTNYVRKSLFGKANVYRLHMNGGSSHTLAKKVADMHKAMENKSLDKPWSFQWDVIHFNVGLHDLKYVTNGKLDLENGKQVSSIAVYQKNLRNLMTYFKTNFPGTKLVFATSTPVPENAAGRVAGDSLKYNKAALDVLADYPGVEINDLYRFTKPNQKKWWIKPGDVHYAPKGRKAQGQQVAEVVSRFLSN